MSDVGMTGDFDSVIGMAKDEPLQRFLRRDLRRRASSRPSGPATLCAVAVETDPATGLARRVGAVRLGGASGTGDAGILGLSRRASALFLRPAAL